MHIENRIQQLNPALKRDITQMKFRHILTSIIIAACSLGGAAQSTAKARQAHARAHQTQLANAKSRIDKSVISDFIKEDVARREASNGLSAESNAMITDLLKEANTHLGKRYVRGAKGPSAFDCSGFSSYVYRQFGYNLSPSSRQQFTQGVAVERNDLRKGDLVFFTSRSSRGAVGHVGIVVAADNDKGTFKFIHASIKGVKVSNFEGYYVSRYLGARRVITE